MFHFEHCFKDFILKIKIKNKKKQANTSSGHFNWDTTRFFKIKKHMVLTAILIPSAKGVS